MKHTQHHLRLEAPSIPAAPPSPLPAPPVGRNGHGRAPPTPMPPLPPGNGGLLGRIMRDLRPDRRAGTELAPLVAAAALVPAAWAIGMLLLGRPFEAAWAIATLALFAGGLCAALSVDGVLLIAHGVRQATMGVRRVG